jgi:hypothetical protein
MSGNSEHDWKKTTIYILVGLVAYLIWDSYYNNPLTKLAQLIDTGFDRTAGVFVDETGRFVAGSRNVVGDTLIGGGQLIRADQIDNMEDIEDY